MISAKISAREVEDMDKGIHANMALLALKNIYRQTGCKWHMEQEA